MAAGPGHRHAVADGADGERRVLVAFALTAGYMVVQAAAGVYAGSLALIADSAHMLTDAVALALTWSAFRLARRPPDRRRTFGYHRFQVLAAFVNGLALFAIAGGIVWEAIERIETPQPVLGGVMLVAAIIGLLVNVAAFLVLRGGNRANLNLRSALLHVLGDLLGSVGAIAAAALILLGGWTVADPILSMLVTVLVLYNAGILVRDSAHILLEGAPAELDLGLIARSLVETVPGVLRVHHMHAWMLTSERSLVTMHVETAPEASTRAVLAAVQQALHDRFGIEHATIQIEPRPPDAG